MMEPTNTPEPTEPTEPTDIPNPAIVPEPTAPSRRRYVVPDTLDHRVMDPSGAVHWPGEEFEAVFPPEQEARLIRRGQIKRHDQS